MHVSPTYSYIARLAAMSLCLLCFIIPASVAAPQPDIAHMAGQMILVGFRGTDASASDIPPLLNAIQQGKVGGIILFDLDSRTKKRGRNIVSIPQLAKLTALLQKNAAIPLFISVDQEGGKVQRINSTHGVPNIPSPFALAQADPTGTNTRMAWAEMAALLRQAGINLNFAPSLDVNSNPQSPAIGAHERSWSNHVPTIIAHATQVLNQLHAKNIIGCLKHFPGHGSSSNDTHLGAADISQTWVADTELAPYAALINQRVATPENTLVMIGHLTINSLDNSKPASLSRPIIVGQLRNKLGWEGVVITDDLQMRAITHHYTLEETVLHALEADVDILLFGNNLQHNTDIATNVHDAIMSLVAQGKISQERIALSYNRIMRLKNNMIPRATAPAKFISQ